MLSHISVGMDAGRAISELKHLGFSIKVQTIACSEEYIEERKPEVAMNSNGDCIRSIVARGAHQRLAFALLREDVPVHSGRSVVTMFQIQPLSYHDLFSAVEPRAVLSKHPQKVDGYNGFLWCIQPCKTPHFVLRNPAAHEFLSFIGGVAMLSDPAADERLRRIQMGILNARHVQLVP